MYCTAKHNSKLVIPATTEKPTAVHFFVEEVRCFMPLCNKKYVPIVIVKFTEDQREEMSET